MPSRLHYFDNLKFLLILLVVVGHVIDESVVADDEFAKALFIFIYSFHMPLFIFVSGVFINTETLSSDKALRRVCLFIVLGFITKLLMQVVPVLFGQPFYFALLKDGGISWYMFVMAAFYTLAYLLKNINPTVILAASLTLGTVVGYDSSIGDYLYLSRIVVFFPFFWAGTMLRPSTVSSFMQKTPLKAFGFAVVIAFMLACIFYTEDIYAYRGLFTGRNSFEVVSHTLENCSAINRIIAYTISAAMCVGIMAIVPHRKLPVISKAGARTLQIYVLHYVLIKLCVQTGLLAYLASLPDPGWVSVIALGIAITFIVAIPILGKPLDYLTSIICNKQPEQQAAR